MNLTIRNIANSLNMDANRLSDTLDSAGITVKSIDANLTELQVMKIKELVNALKVDNSKKQKEEYQFVNNMNELERLVKECIIFVDTCSFMHDSFYILANELYPLLVKYNKKIIVATKVIEELKKHSRNEGRKPDAVIKARRSIKILTTMNEKNLIQVRGEKSDNFADNVFGTVFAKHRLNHKLLLITQDRALATDILSFNNMKSARGHLIRVKRIDKHGIIRDFDNNGTGNISKREKTTTPITKKNEKFKLVSTLYKIDNTCIKINELPVEGSYVNCGGKKIQLTKAMASGGEGIVYKTNTPYVCKIYKPGKNEKSKFEKLKLMTDKKIEYPGICWPIEIAYNNYNEPVGYIMKEAKGKEIQKSLFVKPLLLKNFPNWNRKDTVELCLTILDKIQYLHERNIILGDINPLNILVVSPKEVYFVDTDSYQIEGYPCPVGTINFTAPEIQRKKFDTFLRSFGNEYFAVATLLFMIMNPGKPPYSQQGGENPVDNILKMDFSYPFEDKSNKKIPDGPWRYTWSHLSYAMKEAFYTTFRKGAKNSTEQTRLSTKDWQDKMSYYFKLLNDGTLEKQDPMAIDLFPTRHKRSTNLIYGKCKLCNREFPEDHMQEGICKGCLNLGEKYRCNRCNKEMVFTNYARYIRKVNKYEICKECMEYLNGVYTRVSCNDCSKTFEITNSEYEFIRGKNYDLPKRCKECRKKAKNTFTSYNSMGSRANNSTNKSNNNREFCFITTAACEFFNKEDNCYELTTFREFRDNWLANEEDGLDLIREYYEIAPAIVQAIDSNENREELYKSIWNNCLIPCLHFIEEGKFKECKELYIEMVESLYKKFI